MRLDGHAEELEFGLLPTWFIQFGFVYSVSIY